MNGCCLCSFKFSGSTQRPSFKININFLLAELFFHNKENCDKNILIRANKLFCHTSLSFSIMIVNKNTSFFYITHKKGSFI